MSTYWLYILYIFLRNYDSCPDGFEFCATKYGTCVNTGVVSWGDDTEGVYSYQDVTGSIECTDSVFGDPGGTTKNCCKQTPALAGPTLPEPIVGSISCGDSKGAYIAYVDHHYWKLITTQLNDVTFSTCSSNPAMDSTLTVYNAVGSKIVVGSVCTMNFNLYYNDCGNCSQSHLEKYTISSLPANTYYIRTAQNVLVSNSGIRFYQLSVTCQSSTATSSPTTIAPTTSIPTTDNPTNSPITKSPTTNFPTTSFPTTSFPSTIIPSTNSPSTNGPITQFPTTSSPSTSIPSNVNPTTATPSTQNPTTTSKATTEPTIITTAGEKSVNRDTTDVVTSNYDESKSVQKTSSSTTIIIVVVVIACVIFSLAICFYIYRRHKKNNLKKGADSSVNNSEMTQMNKQNGAQNNVEKVKTDSIFTDGNNIKTSDVQVLDELENECMTLGNDNNMNTVNRKDNDNDNDVLQIINKTAGDDNDDEMVVETINESNIGGENGERNEFIEGVNYMINKEGSKKLNSWLDSIGFNMYFDLLVKNGFDSIEMMKEINNKEDLNEIGITLKAHQLKLMNHIKKLDG